MSTTPEPDEQDVPSSEVPSSIDLRDRVDATQWVASAEIKRPWRGQLRQAIAELLRDEQPCRRILELGPGPGLLAEAILDAIHVESYVLFDFSEPMLELCRQRLSRRPGVSFVLGDFTGSRWTDAVAPPFDAVVAMQAVHEVRHKRHVPRLYRHVLGLLRPGGLLAVCDHEPMDSSPRLTALHSTEAEQHRSFADAGFIAIKTHLSLNGLYLCSGRRSDR
jgi:SAM-dependent methyltransferase